MSKSKTKNILSKNIRNLSIQFSLDGFSFCIKNDANEIIISEVVVFENQAENPSQLLEKIETIFSTNSNLQQDFETVFVVHQNNLATFVPEPFFDETKLNSYLKYNLKVLPTDFVTFDTNEALSAKNVYIPYVNINNYLFQHFGEFTYKHHLSVLADKLLKLPKEEKETIFVNIDKTSFDVLVLKNGKLIFSNIFSYQTKEDFIYYILFVFEQLKLDPEHNKINFIGDINKENDIYKITYKYIRNTSINNSKNYLLTE